MRLKYNFIGLILACGLGLSSCNDSFWTEILKTNYPMHLSGKRRRCPEICNRNLSVSDRTGKPYYHDRLLHR